MQIEDIIVCVPWKNVEKVIEKPKPKDLVDKVYVNYEKGTTTVAWLTGETTTVCCQAGEDFDIEKGIALCFMKYIYGNTGYYNNYLNKYIDEHVESSKKKKVKKSAKNWIHK